MDRTELRKSIINQRLAMPESEVENRSRAITAHVLSAPAYQRAKVVMSYIGFRQEVETRELVRAALAEGKRVAVPRVDRENRRIEAVEIRGLEDLAPGAWGILEPRSGTQRVVAPVAIDLVIVPGVAFDRAGNRLGYGGGYYDRFLPALCQEALAVGLAYSFQVLEKLSPGKYDVPVDWVVTEEGIIYCRHR